MAIDILLLREEKGGKPEVVRASEKRRCRSGSLVDRTIETDKEWRSKQFEVDNLKKELNLTNKEVSTRKKVDKEDPCTDLLTVQAQIKEKIADAESSIRVLVEKRDMYWRRIGNLVDPSVLASDNEDQNEIVRKWGDMAAAPSFDGTTKGRLGHADILPMLNGCDLKRGAEVAGHRGYYLKGVGVMLNQALIQYGLSFLRKQGFTDIQPPFFMRREIMEACAELKDFEDTLYKIPAASLGDVSPVSAPSHATTPGSLSNVTPSTTPGSTTASKDDLFLIATSEQPMCALHKGEYMHEKDLPIKYVGVSSCFRKEAGSHGKDMRGIFRIHQFEKIEQFVICKPEDSAATHEKMIEISEEFYQSLKLPYRVVSIVAGALNDAATKKYDLEAWFPSYNDYRELVSCSNCTDYQSRDLAIRLGSPKMQEREKTFVHLLNGTLCATERTMCCILENYQTPEGVLVPRVLQPYMDGLTLLPYSS